jgi:hypothetical protein
MAETRTAAHRWTFFRTGGLDQVALKNSADLLHLKQLDQKLWVALSCPVKGLQVDDRTLELLDTDHNGRVRVPEILAAIDWLAARLKSVDEVLHQPGDLPLASISDQTPEGKTILASARQILRSLAKADANAVTVEDLADKGKIFANTRFNGDGIITPESTDDAALKSVITDIMSVAGTETDRGGKAGLSQATADQFFADVAAYLDWMEKGLAPEIRVAGENTAAAFAAVKAARAKVDDYFARCSLASFDPRALSALNRQESEYLVVASKDLTLSADEMTGFPLARIEPGRPLPLVTGLNPGWAGAIAELRRSAVALFFGATKDTLSAEEWTILKNKLAAFEKWQSSRTPTALDKLSLQRIREIATLQVRAALTALVAEDKSHEPEMLAIGDVERLARYYRDFGTVLRNFVNFADFYDPTRKAMFQAGTLYLDSRSCELCIRVDDPGAHAVLASLSKCYIAYCDLKRVGGETMKIAACFTQGDSDYLMVGRNGLFYDRQGRDWDATIAKIIDNPISVRQAFWSPYKKFVRMVEEQLAKRAGAADTAVTAKLAQSAESAANLDKNNPAAPTPAAKPKQVDLTLITGIAVAIGSIGGFLAAVFAKLVELKWWQYPLVVVGAILLISLPAVVIAWLKLRQRTLGPILDANGWAVNGRVKINIPFGVTLTKRAKLPPGSTHLLKDPFADKEAARRKFWTIVIILLAVAGYGYFAYRTERWPFHKEEAPTEQKPAPDNIEKKTGETLPGARVPSA